MKIVAIGDGWTRYKSTNKIPPGEYIFCDHRPTTEDKKYFPYIAASGPGGRFVWLLPAEDWILKLMFGVSANYELEKEIDTTAAREKYEELKKKIKFHSFQQNIIESVFENIENGFCYRKGIIAGVGGGKTLTTLVLTLLGKAVYVAPKHTHGTIRDEAIKWGFECPKITTPESSHKIDFTPDVVIVDECLSVKNPSASRSKKVYNLAKDSSVVVAMTGTPMSAEHDKDLRWLRVCATCLPESDKYMKWNWGINPHHRDLSALGVSVRCNERGEPLQPLEVDGWKHDELASFLKDNIHIVDISEIQKTIPEATSQKIYLPAPKSFRAILRGLLTQKSSSKRLTQARSCSSGFVYSDDDTPIWIDKNPAKIAWVKDFIENNPGEPVIIFSGWRAEIEKLSEELSKYSPAVVSDNKSSSEVERFTTGQTDVIICSAALTEGMNLQRSRISIFCSNSTNPTKRVQAKGRNYRQGQKRGVIFYDLICENTLDSKALNLLETHLNESEEFIKAQLLEELKKLMKGK